MADAKKIKIGSTWYNLKDETARNGLSAKAPLASPALTGTPTAPTASSGTNTTQIATTAFVQSAVSGKANTASPTFTGTPKAPTAASGTNTTQIATTAFVSSAVSGKLSDAPSDGKQYARQDGAWAEVSGGGGSSETQPWPITSLDDDTIQKWATIPNGTYWYNNDGYFNSPEGLGHGFLEHKVDADSFNVTQTFYGQSDQPTYRRSGNILGDFSYWFRFDCTELNTWYLPKGIKESNVIAAYQFVGRNNQNEALLNINTGTQYPLSKINNNESWSNNKGFYIPGNNNSGLNNSSLQNTYSSWLSAAYGYSGLDTSKYSGPGIMPNTNKYVDQSNYRNAVLVNGTTYSAGNSMSNGVVSVNFTVPPEMYRNGSSTSISGNSSDPSGRNKVFGVRNTEMNSSQIYVTAIVIYNVTLTASQHMQLYGSIYALGGI